MHGWNDGDDAGGVGPLFLSSRMPRNAGVGGLLPGSHRMAMSLNCSTVAYLETRQRQVAFKRFAWIRSSKSVAVSQLLHLKEISAGKCNTVY